MRQAGPLPDVPLIILTGTGIDAFKRAVSQGAPESLLRAEIDGKLRLYHALAGSVPRGENRVVEGAGHASIHWSHPGAVLQAIQDLISTLWGWLAALARANQRRRHDAIQSQEGVQGQPHRGLPLAAGSTVV